MPVEYDPFSEDVMRDPHPVYKQLRSDAPCYYLGKWDCWALSRFEDIWQASMDAENYSTAQGTTAAHLLTKIQPVTPMLNLMDPPPHTQLRSKIRRFFTPGRVNQLQPEIQQIVQPRVVEDLGPVELVEAADLFEVQAMRTGLHIEIGIGAGDCPKLLQRLYGLDPGVGLESGNEALAPPPGQPLPSAAAG